MSRQDPFAEFGGRAIKAQSDPFAEFDAFVSGKPVAATTAKAPVSAESPSEASMRQSLVGASPVELLNRMKGVGRTVGRAGMGALQFGQYLTGSRVSPTPISLEPSLDPNQSIGEKVGQAALTVAPGMAAAKAPVVVQAAVNSAAGGIEAGVPGAVVGGAIPAIGGAWGALKQRMPSTVSAGKKFEQLKAAGGSMPIETVETRRLASEALDLTRHGAGAPPAPIREFLKRTNPITAKFGSQKVQMTADPVTLESGLKFSSNAGRISADAAMKMNPTMKAKLAQFGQAMKTANRDAASKVGMGDVYDAAMKEYRQAKTLEEAAEIAKKWGIRAVAAAGIGAAAREGAQFAGWID